MVAEKEIEINLRCFLRKEGQWIATLPPHRSISLSSLLDTIAHYTGVAGSVPMSVLAYEDT